MPKYLFILFSLFFIQLAHAQNGYTLKLSCGLGSGWANESDYFKKNKHINNDVSAISGITVGYNLSNIRLNAGLKIFGTTYSNEMTLLQASTDPQTGNPLLASTQYKATDIYRYIVLPVTVGYTFNAGHRLVIIPEVGLMPAYDMGIIHKLKNMDTGNETSKTGKPGTTSKLFSLSGIAMLNVEYYVTPNTGFLAGATYTHTLTNLLNIPDTYVVKGSRRESAYTINIGVVFKL